MMWRELVLMMRHGCLLSCGTHAGIIERSLRLHSQVWRRVAKWRIRKGEWARRHSVRDSTGDRQSGATACHVHVRTRRG